MSHNFQRVYMFKTQKEEILEEQVRKDLEGHYPDIDAVIEKMKQESAIYVAKNDKAVYWYGM